MRCWTMSQLGQKAAYAAQKGMSASPQYRPECDAATTRMVDVGIVISGDLVASYFTTTVVPTGTRL
jgi:hypothetical protein